MLRGRPARLVAIVVLTGLALTLAACSDSDSSDSSSTSTSKGTVEVMRVYTERNPDVTVSNGHSFAVELPITTGTGYDWTAVPVPELQQMESTAVQRPNRPGAQAVQRITFRAQGTGATTLTLNYARSFETGVPPADTATFQVTVTG